LKKGWLIKLPLRGRQGVLFSIPGTDCPSLQGAVREKINILGEKELAFFNRGFSLVGWCLVTRRREREKKKKKKKKKCPYRKGLSHRALRWSRNPSRQQPGLREKRAFARASGLFAASAPS